MELSIIEPLQKANRGCEHWFVIMNRLFTLSYVLSLSGTALWVYGYFQPGSPPLFNWPTIAPWLATWLPNLQSEIGMCISLGALIPMYWPRRK
jgi:hypothetical protein